MPAGRRIDDSVVKTSKIHKLANLLDEGAALIHLSSIFWAPVAGLGAGVVAAPALGISAIFAGVAGTVGGLVAGGLAFTTRYSPVALITKPLAVVASKLYASACVGYLSDQDKMRLKDAFYQVAVPGPESEKFIKENRLYFDAGLDIYKGYHTIDSLVESIRHKKYNALQCYYKPDPSA